jgi:hypothetical protein
MEELISTSAMNSCAARSTPATISRPGPPVPESITLPTKTVGGKSTVGTVCLDQVADAPVEVGFTSDNTFLVEVQASVTVSAGAQCADFAVSSFARFPTTESVVRFAFTPDGDVQPVLYVIPTAVWGAKTCSHRRFKPISGGSEFWHPHAGSRSNARAPPR